MIVIAGDSWGCGEWADPKDPPKHIDLHNLIGLGSYLENDGHTIVNCSIPGGSNLIIMQALVSALNKITMQGQLKDISHVFVFQTEWHRDFRVSSNGLDGFVEQKKSFLTPNNFNQDFLLSLISRWQYQLSEVAQTYNLRIGIIGGCSDTMWLDKFESEYPGLYIACQSLTNLCISGNHRIDNPVFSVRPDPELVEMCKKYDTNFLLSQLDLGKERKQQWTDYPEWFFPDGNHGNRHAHRLLHDFLKQTVPGIDKIIQAIV